MPGARILHPGRRVDVSDSQFRSFCTLESLIHPRLREDAAFVTSCLPFVLSSSPRDALISRHALRPNRVGLIVACGPEASSDEVRSSRRRVNVNTSFFGLCNMRQTNPYIYYKRYELFIHV